MKQKPTKPIDVKIETIQREVRYTDKEIADMGRESASLKPEIMGLEDQLDSIKADYKSKIDGLELRRNTISDKIIRGFEMRPAECVVEFNVPKKGRKSFWLHDSFNKTDGKGEFVRDEDMSAADSQTEMFEKKPAVETQTELVKDAEPDEPLLVKVWETIQEKGICNTAFIQRNFKLGHGPAVRILEVLEKRGLVGAEKSDKQRDVFADSDRPKVKTATPESVRASEDSEKK